MSSPWADLTRVSGFTRHEWRIPYAPRGTVESGLTVLPVHGVAIVNNVYYEIRVTGTVPAEALLDFERMNVTVEPVETVLHGPMVDQGALNGLLARLELFGVEVVEVRRLKGTLPPTSGSPPGESA